jgi:uncharacterized protein
MSNAGNDIQIEGLLRLAAISEPLGRLGTELSPNLLYHTVDHTREVIADAVMLALRDQLLAREVELLAVAAAWHDTGFIESPEHNEPIAARMAVEALTRIGSYSSAEIKLIEQMILDTAIIPQEAGSPLQRATTKLSPYLLDADVANFGRDDFFVKGELLRRELGEADLVAYNQKTQGLLTRHVWLSAPAQELWGAGKAFNLAKLQQLLKV